MSVSSLIRDYENPTLPIEKRLSSLARRFPCLRHASGLDPFSPKAFHAWTVLQGTDSSAWYAGHLVLNLLGKGPWEDFDAVGALRIFDLEDRAAFVNWARCWQ